MARTKSKKPRATRSSASRLSAPASAHPARISVQRYLGLSLGGGRADKACLTVLEHYPSENRLFLTKVFDKIKSEDDLSSDYRIIELMTQFGGPKTELGLESPLQLPKCLRCSLKCPGFEVCSEPEMKWLRQTFEKINLQKKPKKYFTPYTQRCVDAYLSFHFEEALDTQHALGANLAPHTARALFLQRRLKIPVYEVAVKQTVWRLGGLLGLQKMHSRGYRSSVLGEEARRSFLKNFIEQKELFIYQQDQKILTEDAQAFESLLCAYTVFLNSYKLCEPRPRDLPKNEQWVLFPKKNLSRPSSQV